MLSVTSSRTLRARFQNICILTAVVAALFAFLFATFADMLCVRYFSGEDYLNLVRLKATTDSFISARENPEKMNRYLQEFRHISGLTLVCLYDAQGFSRGEWHDAQSSEHCPGFADAGLAWRGLDLAVGIPIRHEGAYLGMIYTAGRLVTLKEFVAHEAIIVAALGLCILLYVPAVKRVASRDMGLQIAAVHEQLECFKDTSKTDCTILPKNFTAEMADMMAAISRLHDHYMNTMVSRQTLERSRQWYRQVFSHLIATLKRHAGSDSSLLRDLDDYTLVMQTGNDHLLPAERVFDCAALLDKALIDARRIEPPHKRVHLSVSLQHGMPRFYSGQPELLEALLRHLLLIAFRRTKTGLVLLRIQPEAQPHETGRVLLHVEMEDSGPPLQPWQLRQWFAHSQEEGAAPSDEHTISWIVAARLFRRLDGNSSAETSTEGGLRLAGVIPLGIAEEPSNTMNALLQTAHTFDPLLLAVEPENTGRRELNAICARSGYRVFIVQENRQALEWAACLPVSAVLLNMRAPGAWQDTAQRLQRQMRAHIMAETQVWAFSAGALPAKTDEIQQFLSRPLRPEIFESLRMEIKAFDTGFYDVFDQALRDDLPPAVHARMPYIHQQLAPELNRMKAMAETLSRDLPCPDAAQQAHAVKSAALSLGYFRLAALMTEVEHAALTQSFSHAPQNWNIIAECLSQACVLHGLMTQNPMERRSVAS